MGRRPPVSGKTKKRLGVTNTTLGGTGRHCGRACKTWEMNLVLWSIVFEGGWQGDCFDGFLIFGFGGFFALKSRHAIFFRIGEAAGIFLPASMSGSVLSHWECDTEVRNLLDGLMLTKVWQNLQGQKYRKMEKMQPRSDHFGDLQLAMNSHYNFYSVGLDFDHVKCWLSGVSIVPRAELLPGVTWVPHVSDAWIDPKTSYDLG